MTPPRRSRPLCARARIALSWCAGVAMLAAGKPEAAHAQVQATVRGVVVQADGVTPAAGVVVSLLDAEGAEVVRALSGPAGTFSIRTSAGRFGLRALRVGYRPVTLPSFDVASDEVRDVRLVLGGAAIRLDAVRVEGESSCRIRDDSALIVATLWEQARGVLAASTLTVGAEAYRSVLVRYRNLIPVGSRNVVDEYVTVVQVAGPNGFVALSADSLATQGFVVTAGRRSEFRAPDANVLLSPGFAATHCFRVTPPPREHPGWIGVAFRPAASRRGVGDILGTFWLDRESSELRKLEFSYTNVPSTMRSGDADGWVTFDRLPTGDWFVSAWTIRTPVTDPGSRRMPGMPDTLVGVANAGGITRSVMRDSVVLYENYRGAVTFALVAGDSLNPTAFSRGAVNATQRAGYADAAGSLAFTNLPSGRYEFRFSTPFMEWIGAPPTIVQLDVADTTDASQTVRMPSHTELLYPTCGLSWVVYGYVVGEGGEGVGFAQVEIGDTRMEEMQVGSARIMRLEPVRRIAHADDRGRWRACLAPGEVTLAAHVGEATGLRLTRVIPQGSGFLRVDLIAPDEPPG